MQTPKPFLQTHSALWEAAANPFGHYEYSCVLNAKRNVAAELKLAGVNKVSVSLNAGDSETYSEICKPTFPDEYEAVLDFILKTKLSLDVEVTAVRLFEVDLGRVQEVADGLGVALKVRE